MHSPLPQWNSWEVQGRVGGSLGCEPHVSGASSELSAQSASPSQTHRRGTHAELLQRKEMELQVVVGQEASSLPSSQSASSSHTKDVEMHWPLVQRNSPFVHSFGAGNRWQNTGESVRKQINESGKCIIYFLGAVCKNLHCKIISSADLQQNKVLDEGKCPSLTGEKWGGALTTSLLISTVLTVSFAVTAPQVGHTLVEPPATAELCRPACLGHWGTETARECEVEGLYAMLFNCVHYMGFSTPGYKYVLN